MSIISVWNRKGGVGKTTSVINLASIIAEISDKSVLCIDADSQINFTQFYYSQDPDIFEDGEIKKNVPTIFTVMSGKDSIEDAVYSKNYSTTRRINNKMVEANFSFDILLGDKRFDNINDTIQMHLKDIMTLLNNAYDIILIDFPPTISELTSLLLSMSDYLIVPMIPARTFSIAGLQDVFTQVELVRAIHKDSTVSILGSFYTNVQLYKKDQNEFIQESRKKEISENLRLFNSYITYDYGSAQRSDEYTLPVNLASHNSKLEKDYMDLAKEILKKIGE